MIKVSYYYEQSIEGYFIWMQRLILSKMDKEL
jgi:hypothetical protein